MCVSGAPNELMELRRRGLRHPGKIPAPARANASLRAQLDVRRAYSAALRSSARCSMTFRRTSGPGPSRTSTCSVPMCSSHRFSLKVSASRDVYLPVGTHWISHGSGQIFDGGQVVNEPAPLDHLPVFFREEGSTQILSNTSTYSDDCQATPFRANRTREHPNHFRCGGFVEGHARGSGPSARGAPALRRQSHRCRSQLWRRGIAGCPVAQEAPGPILPRDQDRRAHLRRGQARHPSIPSSAWACRAWT